GAPRTRPRGQPRLDRLAGAVVDIRAPLDPSDCVAKREGASVDVLQERTERLPCLVGEVPVARRTDGREQSLGLVLTHPGDERCRAVPEDGPGSVPGLVAPDLVSKEQLRISQLEASIIEQRPCPRGQLRVLEPAQRADDAR